MKYLIYKITNQLNNNIYIGYHKTENINDKYMGSGQYIKRVIKKYGKQNFIKEILFVFDNEKDMYNKEAEIVTQEFVDRKDTYNLMPGGKVSPFNYGVMVKDKKGNQFFVDQNHPKYLSGEYVSFNKNKIVLRDKEGNTFQVNTEDSRYLSGELFSACKGQITVKDKSGKYFNVKKDDERIETGELVTVASLSIGRKHSDEEKQKMKQNQPDRSGEKNSCYNKKSIYNPETDIIKFVLEDDIKNYLKAGWIIGNRRDYHKEKCMINSITKEIKYVKQIDFDQHLISGWKFGRKIK